MHLLIDGDGPLYRAAAAAQHYEYYIDGLVFRLKKDAVAHAKDTDYDVSEIVKSELIIEEEYAAIHNINSIMGTLLSDIAPRTYTCYIGGNGNYRYLVNPEYKAGRPPRPHHYDAVKEYLIKRYDTEVVNGIEADDACSMAQYAAVDTSRVMSMYATVDDCLKARYNNTCIASNDKDLLMVPGNHYNWQKKIHQFITEDEGDYNFYTQLLTGDSTDNIFGLADIGPARAKDILKGTTNSLERYNACREAYESMGREDLEDVARQIWMSKYNPDDWMPPKSANGYNYAANNTNYG